MAPFANENSFAKPGSRHASASTLICTHDICMCVYVFACISLMLQLTHIQAPSFGSPHSFRLSTASTHLWYKECTSQILCLYCTRSLPHFAFLDRHDSRARLQTILTCATPSEYWNDNERNVWNVPCRRLSPLRDPNVRDDAIHESRCISMR